MSCALDKLATFDNDSQFLETAKDNLSKAISLMDTYYQTWHSIIWIKADRQTKKRVCEQLNNLAFDAYQHFCKATKNLNNYIDNQLEKQERGEDVPPPPAWWQNMNSSLYLAQDCFLKEHKSEIYSKQLSLF